MHKVLLAALAAATVLAGGMLGHPAEAMTPATPLAPGIAGADAALVRRVVNVCGSNGCVKVQTQRVRKRPPPPPPHH